MEFPPSFLFSGISPKFKTRALLDGFWIEGQKGMERESVNFLMGGIYSVAKEQLHILGGKRKKIHWDKRKKFQQKGREQRRNFIHFLLSQKQ
jgi:hypothetical protein